MNVFVRRCRRRRTPGRAFQGRCEYVPNNYKGSVPDVPVRHSPEKPSPGHTSAPVAVPFMNNPAERTALFLTAGGLC